MSAGATVTVVGAGVFGAWSALKLADAGYRVTLVDAYGPANGRASSADHSRLIRAGYGRDTIYSEWVATALTEWAALERESGVTLLTVTGALFLGPPGHGYLRDTFATLTAIGRRAEWIGREDLARRFPLIAIDGLGDAVYEADAGVLRARAAVQAVVRLATASRGVAYRTARVARLDEQRASVDVRLVDGSRLHADHFVFACGPWLPQLVPDAVGSRIRATRQEVLYYGVPAGDDRFSCAALPVWIDFAAGVYGIPDLDSAGFKIGVDQHGPVIDPDTLDRVVDPALVERMRTWLQSRFPALGAAPLVDARVCQYENSPTGDFIIDRHPAWSNAWIVGGGSGHGFKHGPSVARHLVERLQGKPADARFAITSAAPGVGRVVY